MKKELLQIPSTLSNYKSMSNSVIRITFDTQENIEPEIKAKILSGHEKFGWLSFLVGEKKLKPEDVIKLPPLPVRDKEEKSPSQILRSRMFVYYMSCYTDKDGFEEWRIKQFNKIGQQYLDRIDNGYDSIVDEFN